MVPACLNFIIMGMRTAALVCCGHKRIFPNVVFTQLRDMCASIRGTIG